MPWGLVGESTYVGTDTACLRDADLGRWGTELLGDLAWVTRRDRARRKIRRAQG